MTFQHADLVEVVAWGRTVGAILEDPDRSGLYVFEYDPDWVSAGVELSPIHMPNRDAVAYEFPNLDRHTFLGLPGLFADALPDRFGNALVDRRLADLGVSPQSITPLDRLAYAGDRSLGALEFRPPLDRGTADPTAIELADLVVASRGLIAGTLGTDDDATTALAQLISVGTSPGGARAKAVVAFDPGTGQIRSGHGAHAPGFEPWLIKLDGVTNRGALGASDGSGRVEFAYYRMATAAGIEMADSRLHVEHDRAHFMTKRFDRAEAAADPDRAASTSAKIHIQTLCGLAHLDFNMNGAHGYAQYLQVIDQLGLGYPAREQGFRRAVFNVAAANRDDHTKNLSFRTHPDGRWDLAPAYDLTHVHAPGVGHRMSVNGKTDRITRADLGALADRQGVGSADSIIDEVLAAVERWMEFAEEGGVPRATALAIDDDLRAVLPG